MSARAGRLATWGIVAAFTVVALAAVFRDTYLHDEGLLAHAFARWVAVDPLHTLFLQKSRPPIALLFAPFAAIGLRTYLVAHVVLAAAGILATAALARALEHRRPWLVALVLAGSPLWIGSAAAGVSNSDGAAVAAIAGWLWLGVRKPLASGVVLGMLPWIRAELAVLVLATLVVAWVRRERRLGIGVLVFPVIYALAGALVHRDPLWMLHWPPALPEPMPDNPFWRTHDGVVGPRELVGTLLALTPAVVVAVLARFERLRGLELAWALFAAFEIGLLLSLPRWRMFNFDLSPRYLLGVLPALALVIGRAVESWDERDASWRRVAGETGALAGFAALAWTATRAGSHAEGLLAVAITAAAIACVRIGRPAIARGLVVAMLVLAPWAFADGARLRRDREAPEIDEIVARLREEPAFHDRPIYTNAPLLPLVLARADAPPVGEVHYLVQVDQIYELVRLSDPDNGQRAALLERVREGFGAPAVLPGELAPDDVPADALFVLVDDPRLELALPPDRWDARLESLHASVRVRIAEPRRTGP